MDKTLYTKDSIESLSPREHVQLRAGMYIGSTNRSTQLVVEIFSNALDEFNLGHGDTISVTYDSKQNIITVADNGQGFPINEMRKDGETVLQASFDVINTSGKYSDDGVYGGVSLGLNGVGGKATNFLSKRLTVISNRDGCSERVEFANGLFKEREVKHANDPNGTSVEFQPDPQFFEDATPDIALLRKTFNDICGMCPNLTIKLTIDSELEVINHPEGINYLLSDAIGKTTEIISQRLLFQEKKNKYSLDCGLTYNSNSSSNIVAYVNYGLTERGPHIQSLKSTLTRVMNKWAREQNLLKEKDTNIGGESLQEGLNLVFNLVSPSIAYDAQTKATIVSKDFVPFLSDAFSAHLELWLDSNPQDGKIIIEKALLARKAAEAAKKAREAVKKKAERQDRVFKLPTTLVDAWSKDRSKCELMICEGKSAAAGLVAGRDAKFQAVYGVRGMMISARKTTLRRFLQNQEVNNLILALGLDLNPTTGKLIYDREKLRYDKVIGCADADAPGYFIELLLFNILWFMCPELIENGHVYSAEPPLFRVTTKDNCYIYLRDEQALQRYRDENNANIKFITRNKGLGESDSDELAYSLLDPKTRNLVQLTVEDAKATEDLFELMFGKEVSPRVKYILSHSEEVDFDCE